MCSIAPSEKYNAVRCIFPVQQHDIIFFLVQCTVHWLPVAEHFFFGVSVVRVVARVVAHVVVVGCSVVALLAIVFFLCWCIFGL